MSINENNLRYTHLIIDGEILKNGVTDKILSKLIARHAQEQDAIRNSVIIIWAIMQSAQDIGKTTIQRTIKLYATMQNT